MKGNIHHDRRLGSVAALQADCNSRSANSVFVAGGVGMLGPVSCKAFYSYAWWCWAFQTFILFFVSPPWHLLSCAWAASHPLLAPEIVAGFSMGVGVLSPRRRPLSRFIVSSHLQVAYSLGNHRAHQVRRALLFTLATLLVVQMSMADTFYKMSNVRGVTGAPVRC